MDHNGVVIMRRREEGDIEEGKGYQQQQQQQWRRNYPEHTTVGKLTVPSSKAFGESSSWMYDPEIKRQRRIIKYRGYAAEGKMKDSLRSGVRWVKNKYTKIVFGY